MPAPVTYKLTPDQQRLVAENLPIAYHWANRTRLHGAMLEAAEHTAILGLCYAAYRYREGRGAKFSTFACFCVKRALTRECSKQNLFEWMRVSTATDFAGCFYANTRHDGGRGGDPVDAATPGDPHRDDPAAIAERNDEVAKVRRTLAKLRPRDVEFLNVVMRGDQVKTYARESLNISGERGRQLINDAKDRFDNEYAVA